MGFIKEFLNCFTQYNFISNLSLHNFIKVLLITIRVSVVISPKKNTL